MKKSSKIIMMFISILFVFQIVCFATDPVLPTTAGGKWDVNKTLTNADDWKGKGTDVQKATQNVVGTAINVIRIVGTGIAIIMLTYVAIKYMSAAPSEKAEFKKSATAMIVGAIVLFAATNILTIIAKFASANISAAN